MSERFVEMVIPGTPTNRSILSGLTTDLDFHHLSKTQGVVLTKGEHRAIEAMNLGVIPKTSIFGALEPKKQLRELPSTSIESILGLTTKPSPAKASIGEVLTYGLGSYLAGGTKTKLFGLPTASKPSEYKAIERGTVLGYTPSEKKLASYFVVEQPYSAPYSPIYKRIGVSGYNEPYKAPETYYKPADYQEYVPPTKNYYPNLYKKEYSGYKQPPYQKYAAPKYPSGKYGAYPDYKKPYQPYKQEYKQPYPPYPYEEPYKKEPPPPRIVILPPLPKVQSAKSFLKKLLPGFDVYVKKEGKSVRLNPFPLEETSAKGLGAKVARQTLARSFWVMPTEKPGRRLPGIEAAFKGEQFRRPYGKSQLPKGAYVEKNLFALDVPGEKKAIQEARISSLMGFFPLRKKAKNKRR
jgi:hypothetical protein